MKRIKWICLMAGALLIASCGSRKQVAPPVITVYDSVSINTNKVFTSVNANRQKEEYAQSRINLNLEAGVKKIAVGGYLRMKRNDVIQLSLVAFGVVEAGRLEITKDYVMIIDKIGRQYMQFDYKEIEFFKQNGINFYTFQALFWDELFLPGDTGELPASERFQKTLHDGILHLTNDEAKHMALAFLANAVNGLVTQTAIYDKQKMDIPVLEWRYLSWGKLGTNEFPNKMEITWHTAKTPIRATLALSGLKTSQDWETRTEISKKRYKKVDFDTVFRRIMSITL